MSQAQTAISQTSFKEAPYADSSWEVVGELVSNTEFQPLLIESVGVNQMTSDPMFADYGGIPASETSKRWHLPEHLSKEVAEKEQTQAVEEHFHKFTEEQLQALKTQAFEEGRKQGQVQGFEESKQQLVIVGQNFSTLLQDLQAQTEAQAKEVEQQALKLALAIANKLVGYAVEVNPEYIVTLINQALGKAGGANILKVRVSPEDFEFIEVVGVAKNIKDYDGSWKFEADASVKSGCILDTGAGEVDFQLDRAMDRIKDAVLKSKL